VVATLGGAIAGCDDKVPLLALLGGMVVWHDSRDLDATLDHGGVLAKYR